jgi:hypothetical protein
MYCIYLSYDYAGEHGYMYECIAYLGTYTYLAINREFDRRPVHYCDVTNL